VPKIGKTPTVIPVGKFLVGEQHASDQGGDQPVEVQRGAGELRQRNRAAREFGGPGFGRAVDVQAQSEDQIADFIRVHARLGQHAARLAAIEDEIVGPF
jgi:hypothetical protein